MILFGTSIGRDEERFVNAVLQPLWDLQLVVGHQVRELADFDELDIGNTEFLLAALDARPIAGDLDLFERLAARVARVTAENRVRAVDSLLELIEQRHAQFNGTIYQLEPDIKNAPGGLRDIAAMRYLQTLGGERTDGDRARAAGTGPRRRGFPAAGPRRPARRGRPRRQRADPRAPGARRRRHRLQGRRPAAARRGADGRLLPARPRHRPRARPRAARRPAARGTRRRRPASAAISRLPATASASSIPRAPATARRCGSRSSGWRWPTAVRSPSRRSTASSRTSIATPPTTSPAPRRSASSCARCSIRARASTRACPRCTTAAC